MQRLVKCVKRKWRKLKPDRVRAPGTGGSGGAGGASPAPGIDRDRRTLDAVLQNLPAMIWTTDRQLTVTCIHGAGLDRWKLTPEQLVGRPLLDLLVGEPRSMFAVAEHARALRGETRTYNLPWGDRTYRVHVTPIRDQAGQVDGVVGVALDATDQTRAERAERARRESDQRYQAMRNASSFGVMMLGVDGRVFTANEACSRMLGYSADEIRGMNVLAITHPDDVDHSTAVLAAFAAGTQTSVQLEKRYVRKDGHEVTVQVNSALVTQPESGQPYIIAQFADITRRKELEVRFHHAQKMEAVGRLASGVAHDFNNHLTVIKSYTELLIADLDLADPRRGELEEIRRAAEGASGLTGRLLAFSRQQIIEPQYLALEANLDALQKLLHRLIGEDVVLVAELHQPASVIHIDPSQLEQIVMNLAVNARDAMPNGGRLQIATGVTEIDRVPPTATGAPAPGSYATIEVADNGVGMDEATRERIFEPFFTTKDSGKGTGLGLATVQGVVEQAGGFMDVQTAPGRGSTFTVYLPRYDGSSLEHARPRVPRGSVVRGGSETVLVVEDEAAVRGAVRQMLQRWGYTVLVAGSGAEALEVAGAFESSIDLLLTDVVMPGMNGPVVAERMRQIRPEVALLYMSGYVDDPLLRHGIVESNAPFLLKPFTLDSLARKVREVLDATERAGGP
jgi:PAS domain S-box-containing protein